MRCSSTPCRTFITYDNYWVNLTIISSTIISKRPSLSPASLLPSEELANEPEMNDYRFYIYSYIQAWKRHFNSRWISRIEIPEPAGCWDQINSHVSLLPFYGHRSSTKISLHPADYETKIKTDICRRVSALLEKSKKISFVSRNRIEATF